MQMPDITKAQIVALVQAVIAVLVAFSVPISDIQSAALLALTTIVATVLVAADAAIRRGRAKIAAVRQANNVTNPTALMVELEAMRIELEELRKKAA